MDVVHVRVFFMTRIQKGGATENREPEDGRTGNGQRRKQKHRKRAERESKMRNRNTEKGRNVNQNVRRYIQKL